MSHAAVNQSIDESVRRDRRACSDRFYELAAASTAELEQVFLRGLTPDLDRLAGWEFRGLNHPAWARLLGIKKFIKGFFLRDDDLHGYNSPVQQNRASDAWHARPTNDNPRRFGFYRVSLVDPTTRDSHYLHAALLDYGAGGNRWYDPASRLRDYLVRVDGDNEDLYLGKAYLAIGPRRVASNFFLLERHRSGLGPVVTVSHQRR